MKKAARWATMAAAVTAVITLASGPQVTEARAPEAFLATLASAERSALEAYLAATRLHEHRSNVYWETVSTKRTERRRKRGAAITVVADDYVRTFPPVYEGPKLTPDLAKRWAAYQAAEAEKRPPPKPRPGLAEFLSHAKAQYDFVPERIPEREFKIRYAREALAAGLTKDQVVRIYALETSGLGVADMVAGIHPIKKTGTPISTALGYAQLLAANTINELVKSGPKFIERLGDVAAREPQRAALIERKIAALQQMTAVARSIPNEWSKQVSLATTPRGLGMHAINIDGDIGPWLQVIKINGLKSMAERKGKANLTGAEIELMNLAGPGTGLEMMQPVARDAPTPNFFERNAYARNTIVRGKTSEGLLQALDERMNENLVNSGAVEFEAVFDELQGLAPSPPPVPARAARDDAYIPPRPN
ncbi:MAG: hypothetical protein ACT4N2_06515 [Hyphomicrobium sp.]